MKQNDPTFGEIRNSKEDRDELAAALSLSADDLDPDLPAQVISTGLSFCIVPLKSLEVAARLRISSQIARPYLDRIGTRFFHCITRAHSASGADWHARMQFDRGEDPATGSASGCAIAYLVHHGLAASGQPIVIEQGIEMLRPSRIHVSATIENNAVTKVFVGGRTIPVANGRFFLP
jgi:trans-2,3-dihydro-3-hydroxyanthranilate isomerase